MTLADEAIIGSGMAIMNASIINLLVLSVEARDMGLATSMNSTFRYIGSSIGAPIAGTVLSLYTVVDVVHSATGNVIFSFPDATAFHYAFIIGGLTFVIAAFVVLFSREVLGRRMETVKKSTVHAVEQSE
jgi:MFS family permease